MLTLPEASAKGKKASGRNEVELDLKINLYWGMKFLLYSISIVYTYIQWTIERDVCLKEYQI